jgi:two-component system, chemotaxis family, chemotaxis protein CheY
MSKAMIVDDSKAMRMFLSKTLAEVGYEVCVAANGREALCVFEREKVGISLVLVDWNMPEMNGLEFVKAFRSDPGHSSVMLMMVTTETEVDQMVKALEAGANEYVMKPFTKEIIADKLRLMGVLQ